MDSSSPSAAYMHHWTGSALVQIMACRLIGAKPLSEPMLEYCYLDPYEQTSVKFESKYKTFHSWKCIWKCRLGNGGHFSRGQWVKNQRSPFRVPSSRFFTTLYPKPIVLSAGTSFTLPITFRPLEKDVYEDKIEFLTNVSDQWEWWIMGLIQYQDHLSRSWNAHYKDEMVMRLSLSF